MSPSPIHSQDPHDAITPSQTGTFLGTMPLEEASTLAFNTPGIPDDESINRVKVPGYEIMEELGHGGMGIVYKARQVRPGRLVALKMILAGGHASAAELARFRTEAEAIARLQHPNIVQIFEVGERDGLPYFTLEFCHGGSLEKELRGRPLPPRAAAILVEQLARGMEAAHGKNLLHRDLKPANVLLAEDGTRKITDFGLAKKLDGEPGSNAPGLTTPGAILGTPSYMSPEQAGMANPGSKAGNTAVGPACDIYALGAILYECLTGRPPFKAATVVDTLLQVVSEEPVPPRQLNRQVPADLETICLKCLQKEPAQRYVTAADLADDLRRWQRGEDILARPTGWAERGWRWCKRKPALAAALAAVAASLLGGTIVATAFGFQAKEAKTRAEQRGKAETTAKVQAQNEAEAAQAAQDRLKQAKARLLTSMARDLRRKLGLQVQPGQPVPTLSDLEIEILWELGGTAEENLGLQFVGEALRNPATTRQLRNRAGFALHAAVGLDPGRREAMERLLDQHLSRKEISLEEKTDLSLTLAALGGLGQEIARKAAGILTEAMSKTTDPFELSAFAQGLAALAAHLEPNEAEAMCVQAAAILILAVAKDYGYDYFHQSHYALRQGLVALAARMEPSEGVHTLIKAMSQTTSDPPAEALAGEVVALAAARLDSKQGSAMCIHAETIYLAKTSRGSNPFVDPQWSPVSRLDPKDRVAIFTQALESSNPLKDVQLIAFRLKDAGERLEPKGARQVAFQAAAALTQAMLTTKNEHVLSALANALIAMANKLEPRDAGKIAATLTQAMNGNTDAHALDAMGKGLAAVLGCVEPKEANQIASLAAASLVKALKDSKTPGAADHFAQRLTAVTAFLETKEAARFSSQAAAHLIQAMKETKGSQALNTLANGFATVTVCLETKEAAQLASQAAAIFTQAMATADSHAFAALAPGLATVLQRLEPKEAAATLTLAMTKTTDSSAMSALQGGFLSAVERMEPKEGTGALKQAMVVLKNNKGKFSLSALAASLMKIVARLEPKEAVDIVNQAITDWKDPGMLDVLADSLSTVGTRLDLKEAPAIFSKAMQDDTNHSALPSFARCLMAVAGRLEPKEASQLATQAASHLIERMKNSKDPGELGSLVSSLNDAVFPRLDSREATRFVTQAASRLIERMKDSKDLGELGSLAICFNAILLPRLAPKEATRFATQAASALSKAVMSDPKNSALVSPDFVRSLVVLVEHLEATEASQLASHTLNFLNNKLKDFTDPSCSIGNSDRYHFIVLGYLLDALAKRLEPTEARQLVIQAVPSLIQGVKEENPPWDTPHYRRIVDKILGAWKERLEPTEARQLAVSLIQVMKDSRDAGILRNLRRKLAIIMASMDRQDATAICGRAVTDFTLAMSKTTDGRLLMEYSHMFATVLARESNDQPLQRFRSVAGSIGLASSSASFLISPAVMTPALEAPPEPLPSETLVELLKHPLCIGAARRGVLDALGMRYQRTFTDKWDFVRYATENKLGMDLSSPPKRPDFVAGVR